MRFLDNTDFVGRGAGQHLEGHVGCDFSVAIPTEEFATDDSIAQQEFPAALAGHIRVLIDDAQQLLSGVELVTDVFIYGNKVDECIFR